MRRLLSLLACCGLALATPQRSNNQLFRTEIFPEQLEQQQVQLRQNEVHHKMQELQLQLQVSSGAQSADILQQMANLQAELQSFQSEQLRLQEEIQRKLGHPVNFKKSQPPEILINTEEGPVPIEQPTQTTEQRILRQEPPEERVEDIVLPCTTASGDEGLCRPLIKCLAFYADVPELRKQPCPLGQEERGVCCPRKSRPANFGPRESGVLRPPPPPRVEIPPLTPQQLNQAAEVAINAIRDRVVFVENLFQRGIIVPPRSAAAWHQEFFPTTNETLETGEEAQKNVEASTALVNEFNLSPDQGKFALPTFSILNTVIADTCPRRTRCPATKYRSADGSCNNLENGSWGAAGTALQRILPPKYVDGVNAPRTHGSDGFELPSARLVTTFYATEADRSSDNYTTMVMQWGQFLDHDLTHTPISRGRGGSGISCCRSGEVIRPDLRHPDCFPITIPRNDRVFGRFNERCMEFARSLPAPRPECNFGPREQMNQITGYLDGSNIYGSNIGVQRGLRLGLGGLLRVQNVRGRQYLPANPSECTNELNTLACFQAGDGRVNEQIDLALMHTVWLREHNRVATRLAEINPSWSDEALFQEARRIVVAEIQHITYNEFLPILLGPQYMDKSSLRPKERGWTNLYDRNLNGGITNVFATAAFRFGHSQVQSNLHGYGRFGNIRENVRLSKQHFAPFVLYQEGAVDDFIRGLSAQKSQTVDRHFSSELTDHLFQGDLSIGLDLFALNIQRARDHGIPPYNDWREVCGLPRARRWEDLESVMDPSTIRPLSQIYSSVDEIDLFAGAIGERPLNGAVLGPTFVCLIGDQFARLKRADRFFYEEGNQPSTFSDRQLNEIKKTSLSRVLCDNGDDIALMQPLSFIQPSFLNQRVACNSAAIPSVDLRAWAGEIPGVP